VATDSELRAQKLVSGYQDWLRETESSLPRRLKLKRGLAQLYRSKGERYQISEYYSSRFTIDRDHEEPLAQAG
jgi:hypothetical protein